MSTGYISLPVITDSDVIIQQALANISAAIPGWVPREGNLEVLILEQMALAAAEAATTASDVPSEIFTFFGSLVGINPLPGTAETIQVTWTLVNPASGSPGYQIPAGTIAGFYFSGASYEFQTMSDAIIITGASSISLTLQAVANGSVYDLDGLARTSSLNLSSLYLQLSSPDPLVSTILVTSTPATDSLLTLGTDPEATTTFLNRLNAELQLLAPRPITPSDYALFAQNVAGVYRAIAFDGINPFSNWLSVADANMTLAPTSSSAPTGWVGVGDATSLATLSTPGTAPNNYLEVTTAASALASAVPVSVASLVGATTMDVTVGAGPIFGTGASTSDPIVVFISDATNGNECAVIIGASAISGSGSTTSQILTFAAPLIYAHGTSATLTILQGARVPLVGSTPGSSGALAANSTWYQAAAVVECGSDTTAVATPYLVSLATYLDGSTRVLSSAPPSTGSLYDYTGAQKTLLCNIPVSNSLSANPLAPYATGIPASLKPPLASVESFVVWGDAGLAKTHYVYYNDISAVPFRFEGDDNPQLTNSFWNFIPDSNLASMFYANSALGSWNAPSGINIVPGYGFQLPGSGGALAAPIVATSQIFNLPNVASDAAGTSRTYTLFAKVDSSYAGITYGKITVEVWDLSTGAPLPGVSVSPSSAGLSTLYVQFSVATAKDVEIRVIFDTGLEIPLNSSAVVSDLGIMSGSPTVPYIVLYNDLGYSWTPGGLYSTQLFNYPRMVSICPIDVNGMGVTDAVGENLYTYLASRREINFVTNVIQPTYVPIDVEWSAYVMPGYSASVVQAAANTAIADFLNPATWAGGGGNPPSWTVAQTTVRVFDIAGIISSVQGLGSITSVSIRQSYPTSNAFSTDDINMIGVAPLPIANSITGTILENAAIQFSGIS